MIKKGEACYNKYYRWDFLLDASVAVLFELAPVMEELIDLMGRRRCKLGFLLTSELVEREAAMS